MLLKKYQLQATQSVLESLNCLNERENQMENDQKKEQDITKSQRVNTQDLEAVSGGFFDALQQKFQSASKAWDGASKTYQDVTKMKSDFKQNGQLPTSSSIGQTWDKTRNTYQDTKNIKNS